MYDHTKIFRVVLLYEYVAMKSVLFLFWGLCGVHNISGDGFPFAMFLPTWPICLDLVEGLPRQYHWILSCR